MPAPPWLRALDSRFRAVLHEVAKFGVVGFLNFALDVALFNLLRVSVLQNKPITAGVLSTTVAATSSYFMNRHWTWRHRARTGLRRELPLFLVLSGVGLGISTGCLALSHYALGLHTLLADNVAKNGVGLLLGMAWRFWSFKRWVFLVPPANSDPANPDAELAELATPAEAAVRTTA
ncbi:MAG: GtrA family protein [Frankiaceae bacterium]